MTEIVLRMGPRTAEQVLKVLVKEIKVARFRGDLAAADDLEAIARIARDLDQQLNIRYVKVEVLGKETNGGEK